MGHGLNKWRAISSFVHQVRLDDRRAKERPRRLSNLARPSSCVALAGMSTSQTSRKMGGQHIHINRLGGGAVNDHLFWHHFIFVCTLLIIIFRCGQQGGVLFAR